MIRRRSKLTYIVLLPIAVLLFAIGWILYWVGSKEVKRTSKVTVAGSTCYVRYQIKESKESQESVE